MQSHAAESSRSSGAGLCTIGRILGDRAARTCRLCCLLLLVPLMPGCAAMPRGEAVPEALTTTAEIPGIPGARYWADDPSGAAFIELTLAALERERAHHAGAGHDGPLPPADYLALSGGGANGAFGAGLICGWAEAGTRPTFKVVTGVSTGALIAPFAYLGPEYDPILREFYTGVNTNDVLRFRGLLDILAGDSAADNAPLRNLLARALDAQVLEAIAAEHARGRLLLIGTTNLDALRPVIWDIGAIASSGHQEALELVHDVIIASTAIPAAFPPVFIDVEANGERYQEMHVDGGTLTQVFLYPASLAVSRLDNDPDAMRERRLYVVRNARIHPQWAQVRRRIYTIAARAITSLIQSQGVGDLYRIYLTTQRDEIDFNLAYIPKAFDLKPDEEFDPVYMGALFELARKQAAAGYPWSKHPPGFSASRTEVPEVIPPVE